MSPAVAPDQSITLPTVEVIAATPLLGSGVDQSKVPAQTQVLTSQDIARDGNADALRALNQQVPGVTLDAAAGNPFQPNLFYHGFQASPLQGNPQGLAVYVNGARFNQPFGDTVNWDLIPDLAIDRMDLVGSNPVFGLNALGGALAVQMKNGFTYHGAEVDALGGSFDHYQGELQSGMQIGNFAAYVAASGLHEGGWRDLQSSDLANFYGDLGWRGERGEVHINVTNADTRLNGPGTAPVELLAVDPAAQFTGPNLITNNYTQVNLNANYEISDNTSLQATLYYDYLLQKVVNGNVPDVTPCDDGSGFLCESPGVFATDRDGNPIPDFLNGGPYSDLDQQSTNTNGYGAALQATNRAPLFGHQNQFIAGVSFDGGQTLFGASTEIGGLTPENRVFFGPGVTIDQADGSIAPVRVGISNGYYGAFFTDTFDITPVLSANLAGRYNLAQIDLSDQLGTALSGDHTYGHFNPSAGLTWKFLPEINAYASYAVSNRAPTPAELTCASAASPCSLANFFVGDPSLQQVVAHTVEAGLRGRFQPFAGATLSSDLAFFHTTLDNDILFVNSPIEGRAFFQNVGSTLRQGVDLNIQLKTDAPPRLDRLFIHRCAVSDRVYRVERKQPRRQRRRQYSNPAGRPAARHPGQSTKARRRLQADRRLDGRRHRDLRRRAIPVWRRGQSDAANAALFCARPAYELSGHEKPAAVRAARKRLRRDLLHLRDVFADLRRSRSCRRRAPPIRAATARRRRSPSPSASARPSDDRASAVSPGCARGRG